MRLFVPFDWLLTGGEYSWESCAPCLSVLFARRSSLPVIRIPSISSRPPETRYGPCRGTIAFRACVDDAEALRYEAPPGHSPTIYLPDHSAEPDRRTLPPLRRARGNGTMRAAVSPLILAEDSGALVHLPV